MSQQEGETQEIASGRVEQAAEQSVATADSVQVGDAENTIASGEGAQSTAPVVEQAAQVVVAAGGVQEEPFAGPVATEQDAASNVPASAATEEAASEPAEGNIEAVKESQESVSVEPKGNTDVDTTHSAPEVAVAPTELLSEKDVVASVVATVVEPVAADESVPVVELGAKAEKDDGKESPLPAAVDAAALTDGGDSANVVADVHPAAVVVAKEALSESAMEKAAVVTQSFWRRKQAKRLFEMQSKRARVAKELLETEQTYVNSLDMMIRLYMKPLLASARTADPIMPRSKVQTIFSVVEVMTNLNKVLLDDLKKRLDVWHVDQVLGDIFLTMGDYLKVATQFVNNYETAVATISGELKTNARFKQFYEEMREQPECKRNDLKAFLIMPVQRIPRYEMLLRELIRKTPKDHADYAPLNEAYLKIQSISVLIDSRKDDNVKFQEVLRVHGLLEPKVPNLIAPTRRFVFEVALTLLKRPAPAKARPAPVLCFLFNDMLIMAEKIEEKKSTMRLKTSGSDTQNPPKYRPKETVMLQDSSCHVLKDHVVLKAAPGRAEECEFVLAVPEGADGQILIDFAKHFARTRSAFESNSSSSNLSRKGIDGSEMLPDPEAGTVQKRSSSAERSEAKKLSGDPARALLASPTSAAAQAATEPVPASGGSSGSGSGITERTEEEINSMVEQTKQGTMDMLLMMVGETEAKLAQLHADLVAETTDEGKEKLQAEIKVVDAKVVTMKAALQTQGGVGAIAKRNSLVRSRSNTDPMKPKSFSLRANGKDKDPVAKDSPPPSAKKGLFGTTRAKKKSVDE